MTEEEKRLQDKFDSNGPPIILEPKTEEEKAALEKPGIIIYPDGKKGSNKA